MKKILSLLTICFLSACGGQADFFKPLKPVSQVLPQGLEALVLEDHETPTAQVFLYIRGGGLYDPPGKEGLAALAMQTLRLGGTLQKNPTEIEEDLEFRGSSLEMGSAAEWTTASLTTLKKDLPNGLELLFELLRTPRFDEAQFLTAKAQMKEGLLREREDPMTVAARNFPGFVYGEKSIWGRKPTIKSVESITREDVKRYVQDFIRPDRMVLAAAGDFSSTEFLTDLEKRLQGWEKSQVALPELETVQKKFTKGVRVIPLPNLTQTTIILGHLGDKRDNPDKFSLLVMNFILGGGGSLTSRLGAEIRSSAGKAYGVWSDFGFGRDYGLFRSIAQTANDNTEWVVQKISEMVGALVTAPDFRKDELTLAKNSILRSLFFDFETPFSQVKEAARFRMIGYPVNYLEVFQREIARVTLKDLQRVARQYLHPDTLQVLIVTSEEQMKKISGPIEIKKLEE